MAKTKTTKRKRAVTSIKTAYQRELMKNVERLIADYEQFSSKNGHNLEVLVSWVVWKFAQLETNAGSFSAAA